MVFCGIKIYLEDQIRWLGHETDFFRPPGSKSFIVEAAELISSGSKPFLVVIGELIRHNF